MPELPEVETMVRGIRESVENRTITRFCKCACKCRPLTISPTFQTIRKRIEGQEILHVRRLAKRVVLELSSTDSVVIEPRMTGLMLLSDPPSHEHLRFEWELEDETRFWFWDRRGLGTLRLFTPTEFAENLGPGQLGPDALEMTDDDWKSACERTSRPIKVALLDQKLVAGIGNLYASEILHLAKISPETAANLLTASQRKKMATATSDVLNLAIKYEGSTLGDGTYRNALNKAGGYQNEHRVYGRENEECPTCEKQTIRRIVQAQRSTFYCPSCQKTKTKSS